MKVSDEVQGVLVGAYRDAKERRHEDLTPEHVLYAALFFEEPQEILRRCGIDPEEIKEGLEEHLAKRVPVVEKSEPTQSLGFQQVIQRAVFHTEAAAKESVELSDVLVS